ncbi:SAM-dependent methyltransferase [Marivirga lumbricoides]|uniref:SAM-dependent methyltransferase n=1 Tax=Marivirga lumbricoides TaxID=1046115 RepID=A0ABQ1L7F8_9BACT|nr:SAM-dependent methyltransferase [Marivirga lumbricoides]
MELNESYWTDRYLEESTGWDIGYASPPIVHYVDKLVNKELKILIPGCGNAYEAEYLWKAGFKNVYLADISLTPLQKFAQKVPDFPEQHLLHQDFFLLEEQYDLILEQTFFCALHPSLREKYVQQMHQLLSIKGCLVGLLFNDPLNDDHPPFGGNKALYEQLFKKLFSIQKMETCYNSIAPRQGRELFIKLQPIKN